MTTMTIRRYLAAILGTVLFVCASGCGGAKIRAAGTDEKQEARLAAGDVLTSSTTDPLTKANLGIVTGVLEAPVEQVWAALSDYEAFQRYMPFMKETRVVRSEGTTAELRVTWDNVNLPVSAVPVSIQYWSLLRIRTYPRTYYGEFQQVEGELKRVEGTILLEPFPAPESPRTRIVVSIIFQIGDILDIGARGFFETLLPSYVHNLRKYLKSIDPTLIETKPWAQIPRINSSEHLDTISDEVRDALR